MLVHTKSLKLSMGAMIMLVLLSAFNAMPAARQAADLQPGEPPEPERILEDIDASYKAEEKRVISGDNILNNLFERPFTSIEMVYLPEVDIQTVEIALDDDFYYFTITLKGTDAQTGTLTGAYGIEFDRTKSGRGDLLVLAQEPGEQWSMENVNVYLDENKDIGGLNPMRAEEGVQSDGYEAQAELEGERTAYARLSPEEDATALQIAVSKGLLDDAEEFLWGAWADKAIQDPALFEYCDHFGPSAAGSPDITSDDYPCDQVHSLDNTCRLPQGFNAANPHRGMCSNVAPSAEGGCLLVWRCAPGAAGANICGWVCK